ncbi:hypothetical protein VTN31DRAFT_3078 [Thermomyces dupontii]|uniref:mitochondrial 54S ribosomal protein uL29m n=1 Tax=Talaromyces thermophilus TaxID=28565 RepID=UPI0037437E8D
MHRQSAARLVRQSRALSLAELPPPYLAPSLHFTIQSSNFSSTAINAARRGRDLSKNRGVSAIHRTGPKHPLGVSKYPLPKPVDPGERPPRDPTPNHGLWEFFPRTREALSTPEYDVAHGRAWEVQELREKSWEDLHCLWWVCVKERNRIATSNLERKRLKAGYGDYEALERDRTIRKTQQNIKHVLRERWYAWEDAQALWKSGYRPPVEEDLDDFEPADSSQRKQ